MRLADERSAALCQRGPGPLPPKMMKTSAKLNAGHHPKSSMTMTLPSVIRSARFDTAPPTMRPEPTPAGSLSRQMAMTRPATTVAVPANTRPADAFLPSPKATPSLRTRWRRIIRDRCRHGQHVHSN